MQPHWRIGHRPPGGCTRLWHTCRPYLRSAAAVCLLAVLAAACTDLAPVPATEVPEAVVRSPAAYLREGPDPEQPSAAQVAQGTRLRVEGRSPDGDWLQVVHEGRTLWLLADHTDLDAARRVGLAVATLPADPTPAPATLTVTGTVVNVRTGPGTGYPVRMQVRQGDRLQPRALNAAGDWVQVADPAGSAELLWLYAPLTDLAEHHRAVLPMAAPPTSEPMPTATAPPPAPAPTAVPDEPCPLVWSDEFEGEGLPNADKWWFDQRQNRWNPDALFYTTAHREANARVEDGRLILEAHKDGYGGREYTVPRLTSRQAWTYGWFEMSARLPAGRGTKAAIWMVSNTDPYGGWPNNGEIDIMEFVGHKPGIVHANIHTAVYSNRAGTETLDAQTLHFPDASTAFHRYAVEWTESAITIYADDTPYFVFKNDRMWNPEADYKEWPFDHPFRLILNLYVGGDWAAAKGIDPSIWPQSMELEYVRVYACKP